MVSGEQYFSGHDTDIQYFGTLHQFGMHPKEIMSIALLEEGLHVAYLDAAESAVLGITLR